MNAALRLFNWVHCTSFLDEYLRWPSKRPRSRNLPKENENVQFPERMLKDAAKNGTFQDWSALYASHRRFQKYWCKYFRTCYFKLLEELEIERPKRPGKRRSKNLEMFFPVFPWAIICCPTRSQAPERIVLFCSEPMKLRIPDEKKKVAENDSNDEFIVGQPSASRVHCDSSFKPFYLVSRWNEPLTTQKCVSVAILVPSGIKKDRAGKNMYELEAGSSGCILQLKVTWSAKMNYIRTLHTFWLVAQKDSEVSDHHPKLGGSGNVLKQRHSESNENVYSTCNIALPTFGKLLWILWMWSHCNSLNWEARCCTSIWKRKPTNTIRLLRKRICWFRLFLI